MTVSRDKKTIQTDIVLDLLMTEGTGTRVNDVSRYHNYATLTGPTWTQLASGLWVNTFDGLNDYGTILDAASLDVSGAITIEMWIRPHPRAGGVVNPHLLKKANAYVFFISGDNAGLSIRFDDGGGEWSDSLDYNGALLTVNVWHHAIGIYNGSSTLTLYLDGAQIATGAAAGGINTNANNVLLGENNGGGEWYDGDMGLVRVFNRALSAAEVYQRYQATRALFGV